MVLYVFMMSKLKKPSLQNFCIENIVRNFNKICAAHGSTDTKIPKIHFEFLQRVYTSEILQRLDHISDDYLNFLLNKHVKELDLTLFEHCSWDIVKKHLHDITNGIRVLKAHEMATPEELEILVQSLSSIEVLDLRDTGCNDRVLETIGKSCTELKKFYVSHCPVTNAGMGYLCRTNDSGKVICALQEINVEFTRVDDDGVAFLLLHMQSLEVLVYAYVPRVLCALYDAYGETVKTNLTTLDINSVDGVGDSLRKCVSLCPHVKKLSASLISSDVDLDLCSKFSQIESVNLSGEHVFPCLSINTFLKICGTKLRRLELLHFSLDVKVLAESCPKLQTLLMKSVYFPDQYSEPITTLDNLKAFSFEEAIFTNSNTAKSVAAIITASPNLQNLGLLHCQSFNQEITDAVLKICSNVNMLDFSFSEVELPFLETILFTSPKLKKLSLDYCECISISDYNHLLDLVMMIKSDTEVTWADDDASDYTPSDYDDFYDEFDDYDYDTYDTDGYDSCEGGYDDDYLD